MKTRILFLCAVMLFAFGCGSDDAKYAEQRKLVEDLLIPGERMEYKEIIELYDGVAFYSPYSAHEDAPWWFVRDGKVYALEDDAKKLTPKALWGAPSIRNALVNIEDTRKNPPQVTKKHTGKGSPEFLLALSVDVENQGGRMENLQAVNNTIYKKGESYDNGSPRASYYINEEGGYITSVSVLANVSADEEEEESIKDNTIAFAALSFPLVFFTGTPEESRELLNIIGPSVLNDKEKESSITKYGLKFTLSLIDDYSEIPASEVPENLSHIKKPMVLAVEIKPAE